MTSTPSEPPPDHVPPPACAVFEVVVQAVLDHERSPTELAHSHTLECTNCRDLAAAARVFLSVDRLTLPEPSPELTNRVLATLARDTEVHRARRTTGTVLAALIAASVLIVGVFVGMRPTDRDRVSEAHNDTTPSPQAPLRVGDQFADAGSALARITSRVTDRAMSPTRTLLSPPEVVMLPREAPMPSADPFAAVPESAQAGLEPVTATTRRAVDLFLRDFGMSPSAKPNS